MCRLKFVVLRYFSIWAFYHLQSFFSNSGKVVGRRRASSQDINESFLPFIGFGMFSVIHKTRNMVDGLRFLKMLVVKKCCTASSYLMSTRNLNYKPVGNKVN
jgi:hypothetical protein